MKIRKRKVTGSSCNNAPPVKVHIVDIPKEVRETTREDWFYIWNPPNSKVKVEDMPPFVPTDDDAGKGKAMKPKKPKPCTVKQLQALQAELHRIQDKRK